MELIWPFVAVLGLLALVATIVLAWFLPFRGVPASLPRVSRSYRLTRMPQYRRALRVHQIVAVAVAVIAAVLSGTAIVGAARPSIPPSAHSQQIREGDVIFCTKQDFSGHAAVDTTAGASTKSFFSFLQEKQKGLTHERLGLSGEMVRPIPLTGDQEFLQDRLGKYVDFENRPAEILKDHKSADYARYSQELARFGRGANAQDPHFADYSFHGYTSPHVDGAEDAPPRSQTFYLNTDRLGFCLSGFPAAAPGSPPRSLIVFDDESALLDPLDQLKDDIKRGAVHREEVKPIFEERDLVNLARQLKVTVSLVLSTRFDPKGQVYSESNPLDDDHTSAFAALWRNSGGIACRFYDPAGKDAQANSDASKQSAQDEQNCLQKAWNRAERTKPVTSVIQDRRPEEITPIPLLLLLALSLAGLYVRVGA